MNENIDKIILLTFDYEIFLKRSGSPEKCIIEPVDRLIKIFDRYDIRATFFIDTLYYQRLMENKTTLNKAKLIKNQLQEMISKGHRIELHLHPIWLDAVYHNEEWLFNDYKFYRLDGLDKSRIEDLFMSQIEILSSIAKEVSADYEVLAFRAGGLCIEPFELIGDIFHKTGLKIDSSVAYNTFNDDGIHNYDFRNSPDLEYFKFSDNTNKPDKYGLFFEIPITTFKINFADKIIRKINNKLNKDKFRIFGDGEGINIPVKRTIKDKISDSYSMFTLEGIDPDFLLKNIKKSNKKIINLISHPKLLSESSIKCIDKLHSNGFKFYNMKEILEFIENRSGE